jgi:tripartite-type tricarboxylate transporter receptor subunit TctC
MLLGPVFAQDFPAKPIKVIVPYAAGGASDMTCRAIQKVWKKYFPQPLVIVNKPGAGGMLGAQEALNASPDGYTLLSSHFAMTIQKETGRIDFSVDDFEKIAATGQVSLILIVHKNSPYKTLSELVESVKAKPNTITQATNLSSYVHFAGMQFSEAAGIQFRFVQVGGGGKRIPNMLGEHSDTSFQSIGECYQYYQSGEFRVLAHFGNERHPKMPDVSTIKELGYSFDPLILSFYWLAPKGTPKDRVAMLAEAIEKSFKDPDAQSFFEDRAFVNFFAKGSAFKKQVDMETELISSMAKKFGLSKK